MPSKLAALLVTLCLTSVWTVRGQDPDVLFEFDGSPGETWKVAGKWGIERDPQRVHSGRGSLRAVFEPPQKKPGLTIPGSQLPPGTHRLLLLSVFSEDLAPRELQVLVEDAGTGKREGQRHRRTLTLVTGWNHLELDLEALATQDGSRALDPTRLRTLRFWVHDPTFRQVLWFDALRLSDPTPRLRKLRRGLRSFLFRYRQTEDVGKRLALLEELRFVDDARRVKLLAGLVLQPGVDPRLVDRAVEILGRSREKRALKALLARAKKAPPPLAWVWHEILGRLDDPSARAFLHEVHAESRLEADRVSALRALVRRDEHGLLEHLRAELPGGWQMQRARLDGLRHLGLDQAFPAIVAYLGSEHEAVIGAAESTLVALAGRDFGRNPRAWLDWWKVNKDKARPKGGARHGSRYARYYGIPLLPGRIAFVIDVSGSMEAALGAEALAYVAQAEHLKGEEVTTRIELARLELAHAIRSLGDRAAFNIVWFGNQARVWNEAGALRATPLAKAKGIRRALTLPIEGSTNMHEGLLRAFLPDERRSYRAQWRESVDTIFLLSDGAPSAGAVVNRDALRREIRRLNRNRMVRIHTIGIGVDRPDLLRQLAADSGGRFVHLKR
jgi:hypothetical protein